MTNGRAKIPLGHAIGTSLILQSTGLGLLMIAQILIARVLGAREYGTFSYATACATTMIAFAKFGTDTLAYRYIAQYFSRGEWSRIAGLLERSQGLIAKASLAACVLLAVYAAVLYAQRRDLALSLSIVVASLGVPIVALSTLRQATLITIEKVFQGLASDHLVRTITLIAGAWLLAAANAASAPKMVLINVFSYLTALVCAEYWLRRSAPLRTVPSTLVDENEWATTARGLFFLHAAYLLCSQYDILLVGYLFDSRSTGIYAGAKQIASVGMLGLFALQLIISPRIASAYQRGDTDVLAKMSRLIAIGGISFTAAYALLLVLSGTFLLSLLGPEFREGGWSLFWLMCAQTVNALAGPAGSVAAMLGLQRPASRIYLMAALIGSISTILLGKAFGIDGAAASVVLSTGVWCVGMNVVVFRATGLAFWVRGFRQKTSND